MCRVSLLPARMVNEFVYCPRLAYLKWVQGEWDDSADTVQSRFTHRRVDPEETSACRLPTNWRPTIKLHARSIMLSSNQLGLIAKIDLIAVTDGEVVPVDYTGERPRTRINRNSSSVDHSQRR